MPGSLRKKFPDSDLSRDASSSIRTGKGSTDLTFAGGTKPLAIGRQEGRELREVMDIRQAAEYLGISADSLYKYASENVVPAFRLGNRWRFKRSLLDDWMEQQSLLGPVAAVDKTLRPKQKKPVSRAR